MLAIFWEQLKAASIGAGNVLLAVGFAATIDNLMGTSFAPLVVGLFGPNVMTLAIAAISALCAISLFAGRNDSPKFAMDRTISIFAPYAGAVAGVVCLSAILNKDNGAILGLAQIPMIALLLFGIISYYEVNKRKSEVNRIIAGTALLTFMMYCFIHILPGQ